MSDGADFLLPDGTIQRVAPLIPGSRLRPLDATFKTIVGGTKADLDRGASDKSAKTFDGGMAEDGKVTSTNWGFKIAGLNKDSVAFRDFYGILETAWAGGTEVWYERLRPTDTDWKGGVVSVMSLPEPLSADNMVDWSADLKGRGLFTETPKVP